MNKIEERIRTHRRNRIIIKEALQMAIPSLIGAMVLWFTLSENHVDIVRITIFCGIIVVITAFIAHIDGILAYLNLKRIPFISLQLAKIVLLTISVMVVFMTYFYLKEDHLIIDKDHFQIFVQVQIYSWVIGSIFTLVLLFNKLVGYGVILKYISGKYHNPREEERIFMFLDIKNSTAIAENIGHKKFFSLINDFICEITPSIIQNNGEIYKYVGDEIIITWSMKNGIKHNNCIQVFFDIETAMAKANNKFIQKYGLVPEFKAGVHYGKVIIGEMGDFKSEIAYMGDAVNTSSRLQRECNAHDACLLISEELLLCLEKPFAFNHQVLSSIRLKGKLSDTVLIKITQ